MYIIITTSTYILTVYTTTHIHLRTAMLVFIFALGCAVLVHQASSTQLTGSTILKLEQVRDTGTWDPTNSTRSTTLTLSL